MPDEQTTPSGRLVSFTFRVDRDEIELLRQAATIHTRSASDELRIAISIYTRKSLLESIRSGQLDSELPAEELAGYAEGLSEDLIKLEHFAFARPERGAALRRSLGEIADR